MINWQIRYAAVLERHPELLDPQRSVLEVGSGSQGLARYAGRRVVGVDREFAGERHPNLTAVAGSVLCLPFADKAFDDVVCVDTFEHLDKGARAPALHELIRVARKRVVVAGPAGGFAARGDAVYAEHLARTGVAIPTWLTEHLHNGIPTLAEMVDTIRATGHAFTVHANEGILQHYAGLFADDHPFLGRFIKGFEVKSPTSAPLRAAPGDVPYSYQFTIDVTSRPIIAQQDATESIAATVASGAGPAPAPAFRLFMVGHRTDRMLDLPGMQRILAGAHGSAPGAAGDGIQGDDGGDSIAHRNAGFSELTAIYWVWKNVPAVDAVGFCHYRRFFDFRRSIWQGERKTDLRTLVQVSGASAHFADRSVIDRHLSEGAIIVARPEVLPLRVGEQYMWAHYVEHYLMMANYVVAHHPHLAPQLVDQLSGRAVYTNNMFIMPWRQFDRLCRFWFDCLFGIEKELDAAPSAYQGRTLAFLSERLLDIHLRSLRDDGQRIVEYPIFFLQDEVFS